MALASIFSDIVDAIVDEFTTDLGLINLATLVIMGILMSGSTPWRVLWAVAKLAASTVLTLCNRNLPDGLAVTDPDLNEPTMRQGTLIGLTGILSIVAVQNLLP